MPKASEFVSHVVELMRGLGAVQAKPMFGAWGLYHEGLCFALVADDVLYLKCDAQSAAAFDASSLPPFVYESKVGERLVTAYRQAPADALEDPVAMVRWARDGFAAALRAAHGKPPGKARGHFPA